MKVQITRKTQPHTHGNGVLLHTKNKKGVLQLTISGEECGFIEVVGRPRGGSRVLAGPHRSGDGGGRVHFVVSPKTSLTEQGLCPTRLPHTSDLTLQKFAHIQGQILKSCRISPTCLNDLRSYNRRSFS